MTRAIEYMNSKETSPCFFCGDALDVLATIPENSIDCIITSPPYYMKRQYLAGGIGMEKTYQEYIDNLLQITDEISNYFNRRIKNYHDF